MEVNTIKILIIEDETIVALDIKSAVLKLGFEVTDTVTSYDEAIQSVKENMPDIALVDINLENSKDGIEIVKELQKTSQIAFIYLTAFCDDETIKRAIETNPIGYLLKPFKRDDLKSTLFLAKYKIKNKTNVTLNEEYKDIGNGYFYDEKLQNVYYKNILINLTPNEKKLLNLLYQAKGKIVSFETIEYTLWEEVVSDSTLRTLLYRLRTKLEYKCIETISKVGCRLL